GLEEATYGGKLVENLVSGICRDLLAGAMLACERAVLPVVLHTHDELVCEVPAAGTNASLRQLVEIMSSPPAWAKIGLKEAPPAPAPQANGEGSVPGSRAAPAEAR